MTPEILSFARYLASSRAGFALSEMNHYLTRKYEEKELYEMLKAPRLPLVIEKLIGAYMSAHAGRTGTQAKRRGSYGYILIDNLFIYKNQIRYMSEISITVPEDIETKIKKESLPGKSRRDRRYLNQGNAGYPERERHTASYLSKKHHERF